ncbi:hypothetical protein [Rhodococcoides fascians]|uniref:hypothetical protein n=1 Tax=Rhodococcoides fascians TaxID=1828 RepID=UPI00056AABDE|nr:MULTISPECIES: hypothetical protein [Rhodococcus]OZC50518.1 hypothetical protein CH289_15950 [Rhodococcus sp. RS1C4]OZD65151.1 hypothetical protein CH263_13490 [Rhodococcus sp. 06-1059B-a]OZE98080.1 hypothetical protein CH301_17195 [Rhodococcus sp. 15-1189-1-1a]OZF12730.1 hypothetical protein CH299_17880 [Rhodococcus sp. 14-2686-1-2]
MAVRIEYTEARGKREAGEQIAVDDNSAKVLVEDLKVAKYLDRENPADEVPVPEELTPVAEQGVTETVTADPPPIQTVDGEVVEPAADVVEDKPARKPRGA